MRKVYLLGLLYVGLGAAYLVRANQPHEVPYNTSLTLVTPQPSPNVESPDAVTWFHSMKAYCNPVEVETRMGWSPAPRTADGVAYGAACLALAGHVDAARDLIMGLETDQQWRAAGVVFDVGHPVADAGNEEAAGPLMELVVEFWPNHYMALYHAGAARYALGDAGAAHGYLQRFLEHYGSDDGWRRNALAMIAEVESP